MNSVNPVDKRIIAKVSPAGKFTGTVVLTGQPSVRKNKIIDANGNVIKKTSGKCYEFVFPDITEPATPYQFDIDDELYKDFCFIYKDSEDWKYWKGKMERGDSVPVFFAVSKDKIIHFGLSYLYKLPYKKRIKNCLPESHLSARLDLSESIFGTTNPTSLKGRVQFSHAFMQKGEVAHELESYMGSPKSTYYPIYLEQPGKNGYMNDTFVTMMSDKARLKGWKRYPVREMAKGFEIPEGMKDENISLLTPIEKGAEFVCKIRFHNLRKVEIGALLSAISLNNNGYHSIGYAKSYGFGKVRIEQTLKTSLFTKEEYVRLFKEQMNKVIPNYNNENALKELFLMSFPQKTIIPLEYMQLEDFPEPKKQKKDKEGNFVKTGEYLPYYSELIKKETPPPDKIEEANAVVTLVEGPVIKAKLSNDATTYDLKVDGKRPKQWNNIKVRVIKKGGKIVSLILISISK
jgi:CRISPR-associated protein (TIGR03986 family)